MGHLPVTVGRKTHVQGGAWNSCDSHQASCRNTHETAILWLVDSLIRKKSAHAPVCGK